MQFSKLSLAMLIYGVWATDKKSNMFGLGSKNKDKSNTSSSLQENPSMKNLTGKASEKASEAGEKAKDTMDQVKN